MEFLGPEGEENKGANQRERLVGSERGVQGDERFLTEAPPPFLLFSTPDLWQWLPASEESRKMGITGRDGLQNTERMRGGV